MKKLVRVKILPKAVYGMNVTGKINNKDGSQTSPTSFLLDDNAGVPDIKVGKTLQPTDKKNATLEAELGETVVTQLDEANSAGIPEFYTIGGKRHSQGGTPLNLPPDSFIFSRDNKMKIDDPEILSQFGKSSGKKKKGYTPADISKQYNINDYRRILADPNSDYHQINTAKQMIENYNLKLGGLAMVQESKKGFENGIPLISMPYLDSVGIDPMELIPDVNPMTAPIPQQQMKQFGGSTWPTYPDGGPTGDEKYPAQMFSNITTHQQALDLLKGQRQASGAETAPEEQLKLTTTADQAYFDALQKYTGLQFQHDVQNGTNTWSPVKPTPTSPTPTPSNKPFNPAFKYEDGKIFQKSQGKLTGDENWVRSNPNMAAIYAKKYGTGDISRGELQKQIQENPELFVSEWGQDLAETAKLESISLEQDPNNTPQYADGGAVGSQKVPSLAELRKQGLAKWDMTAEGYDESQVQPGDYVKKADGKWYQVTLEDIQVAPYEGPIDPKLGDLGEAYGRLEQRLLDNKDLRKALYDKYKENMNKAKPRNNLSEVDLEKARNLSEEEVIANFLEAQKQIMAIQAKGPIEDKANVWDKDLSNYRNTISELGFEPMDAAETAAFQGAYISMQNLADADPEFRKQLSDFMISEETRKGKRDEPGGGTGKASISDIDGWFGNTTIGQSLLYAPKAKELAMKEAEWNEAKKDPAIKHLANNYKAQKTPFWTEDIINEAFALKNLWNIQREEPWNAIPGTKLPNATFMSPDQQIQNILGAAGQGVQGAGVFAGPQSYAANVAGMQANAMSQVANAIGNVQDRNVQVANQFELQRSNIMNQANSRNAQIATNLHDKNAILNQQFTNSKNQAWQQVQEGLVNMWTNRGKTQNLNTFTDQYQIDPVTGYKYFTNPKPLVPKDSSNNDLFNIAKSYKDQAPDMNWKEAVALAKTNQGSSPTAFTGVDPDELEMGYPGGAPSGYYPGR